jgi:hypothetical protein
MPDELLEIEIARAERARRFGSTAGEGVAPSAGLCVTWRIEHDHHVDRAQPGSRRNGRRLREAFNMILKDPVAIVTGAGRGIGAATAMALADAGVTVAAVGIESDLVTHTSNAIARRGGRSLWISATSPRSGRWSTRSWRLSAEWTSWATMAGLPVAPNHGPD